MKSIVWMAVSQDEFRLPIAIADTAKELAYLLGTTESNIRSSASKERVNESYKTKWVRG